MLSRASGLAVQCSVQPASARFKCDQGIRRDYPVCGKRHYSASASTTTWNSSRQCQLARERRIDSRSFAKRRADNCPPQWELQHAVCFIARKHATATDSYSGSRALTAAQQVHIRAWGRTAQFALWGCWTLRARWWASGSCSRSMCVRAVCAGGGSRLTKAFRCELIILRKNPLLRSVNNDITLFLPLDCFRERKTFVESGK